MQFVPRDLSVGVQKGAESYNQKSKQKRHPKDLFHQGSRPVLCEQVTL